MANSRKTVAGRTNDEHDTVLVQECSQTCTFPTGLWLILGPVKVDSDDQFVVWTLNVEDGFGNGVQSGHYSNGRPDSKRVGMPMLDTMRWPRTDR